MSTDLFADIMAASAASSAEEAAESSKAAKDAALERLEGSGHNPFVTLGLLNFEKVPNPSGGGLFSAIFGSGSKSKISGLKRKLSVKKTDI